MDYIYSRINAELLASNSEKEILWNAYETLPIPSEDYYMTIGVIQQNNADSVYLCIKKKNGYIWKLLCRGGGSVLVAPEIKLLNSIISWEAIPGAASYDIYANNAIIANITDTQFDLDQTLSVLGLYEIYVVAKTAPGSDLGDSDPSNSVIFEVFNKYFKFVDARQLTSIPLNVDFTRVPDDFKTNGITVNYQTQGYQYEYFAYPFELGELVDVIQSGQHILGNYTKLDPTKRGLIKYNLYRTTLQQLDADSSVIYFVFKAN